MNSDDYLSTRLQPEADWYDQKAVQEKRCYYSLTIAGFVAAAAVPTSIAAGAADWLPAALGGLVAVTTGVLSLRKCQENWLNYRKTAELLKKERSLFEMAAGPYAGMAEDDAIQQLVERVEGTISVEHQAWLRGHERPRAASQAQ